MTDYRSKGEHLDGASFSADHGSHSTSGHSQANSQGLRGKQASNLVPFPAQNRKPPQIVSFDRRELDQLLNVYGFKVGDGEWRDYAIDMLKDRAIFSVFQRQGDVPLYQIEKNPKLARKQGAYCITNAAGQILKRGHDLPQVLKFFDRKPRLRPV